MHCVTLQNSESLNVKKKSGNILWQSFLSYGLAIYIDDLHRPSSIVIMEIGGCDVTHEATSHRTWVLYRIERLAIMLKIKRNTVSDSSEQHCNSPSRSMKPVR